MEIVLVFVIFGLAMTGLVCYIRKEFKEGDKCSGCGSAEACSTASRRGKCC